MATLVRWEPFRRTRSLSRPFSRFFEPSLLWPRTGWLRWGDGDIPAVDMYETPEELVVRATVPGYEPDEIDVSVSEGRLTIRGEHEAEESVEEDAYICRERYGGSFIRSLDLPRHVMTDDVEADYKNGILTLRFPKREEVKARRIAIRAG